MPDAEPLAWIRRLPDDATYDEALAWINGMRRLLDRWDKLPDADIRLMPPDEREEAYRELDLAECDIRRHIAERSI
jgi:hypothetical protein